MGARGGGPHAPPPFLLPMHLGPRPFCWGEGRTRPGSWSPSPYRDFHLVRFGSPPRIPPRGPWGPRAACSLLVPTFLGLCTCVRRPHGSRYLVRVTEASSLSVFPLFFVSWVCKMRAGRFSRVLRWWSDRDFPWRRLLKSSAGRTSVRPSVRSVLFSSLPFCGSQWQGARPLFLLSEESGVMRPQARPRVRRPQEDTRPRGRRQTLSGCPRDRGPQPLTGQKEPPRGGSECPDGAAARREPGSDGHKLPLGETQPLSPCHLVTLSPC